MACVAPPFAHPASQAQAEAVIVEVEDEDEDEAEVADEVEHPDALQRQPPGFGAVDRYTSHDEACLAVVQLEVPESKPGWRRAILDWCEHRSYHASRSGIVESKVDGSQIHDRDRPTAWRFYEHRVVDGTLDPTSCSVHAVDRELEHDQTCLALKRDWPFNSPTMTEELGRSWMQHPHDMERFGARGPHDHNANAYRTIPGCWDPQQLERFDVSMTVTVRSSLRICECWGCATKRDIRAHWGRRSTRCPSHPGPR